MDVFVDFETMSEAPLRDVGAPAYARHATTDVLCMAYAIDDEPVEIWTPEEPFPQRLIDLAKDSKVTWHAHNADFEIQVWAAVLTPKYGVPTIPTSRWECTAARCAAMSLPRKLESAAIALGLKQQKDGAGHAVMLKLTKPKKPSKADPRRWYTDAARFEKLYDYCMQDVVVEREIHRVTRRLSPAERQVWLLDQKINNRGIPIDVQTVRDAMQLYVEYSERLTDELRMRTDGAVKSGQQNAALQKWVIEKGYDIKDVTAETVSRLLAHDDLTDRVRRVLEIRRDLAKSSIAKYVAMEKRTEADGRIRGSHLYHGASTGRWTGRGVQFQNVPRGDLSEGDVEEAIAAIRARDADLLGCLFPSVPVALSSCLRSMVRAPEGKKLIVVDFAQIEARVLCWLAGQTDVLKQFMRGEDVYVGLASRIYNVPQDQVTKDQRFVGKVATLGLGYGMGAPKFRATLDKYGMQVDQEFAQKVVDVYRDANGRVKRFWYRLEECAVESMARRQRSVRCGRLRFLRQRNWMDVILPSGRTLTYISPQLEDVDTPWGETKPQLTYLSENSMSHKWQRTKTYGGKIAENVTQAIARDFLVGAMQRAEEAGYEVIFHVHDELVVEVDQDFGSIEELEKIITVVPEWGQNCPIAAEGFEAERYRK